MSDIDPYGIVFLLVIELTSSLHTSFAAGVSLSSYTLGEIMFIGFAYAARHWLYSQKKYAELEIYLRKIAKINRLDESEWFPLYRELVNESSTDQKTEISTTTSIEEKPSSVPLLD